MAIRVNRPKFRGIFDRLGFERQASEELLDEFEISLNESRDGLATKSDIQRVDGTIKHAVAEIKADAAESEARAARNQLVVVGVILGAIAIAVTLILAFG